MDCVDDCGMYVCAQSLNSIEDDVDVKAAEHVQAELALLSEVSTDSELKKTPPTRQHVDRTAPASSLSQVCCEYLTASK